MLESGRMASLAPVASSAPIPPQNLEAEEAWAAGLFEGEGSFGLRRNGTVLLSLGSTDKDVVQRFHTIVGTGQVSSRPPGKNGRRKRLWRVDVIRVEDVLRIVDMLYPWLGTRRRAAADAAIATLQRRIDIATEERVCPFCNRSFRPPFTPNAARTKFCRRLCERRWHSRERLVRIREDRAA
jgi:hypothetical protein